MWEIEKIVLQAGKQLKIKLFSEGAVLTFTEVLELWSNSSKFRIFYRDLLRELPFKAFFWETPPLSLENGDQAFEFVVTNSEALARVSAEKRFFNAYFEATEKAVIHFPNLGKDALLLVPCPEVNDLQVYTHLANFMRQAPDDQIDQFWKRVGDLYPTRLSNKMTWLSTAGMGVYWLHLRIDSRPKYYRYQPYKLDNKNSFEERKY